MNSRLIRTIARLSKTNWITDQGGCCSLSVPCPKRGLFFIGLQIDFGVSGPVSKQRKRAAAIDPANLQVSPQGQRASFLSLKWQGLYRWLSRKTDPKSRALLRARYDMNAAGMAGCDFLGYEQP